MTTAGPALVELLTIPEAAERLKCSRTHVYNLINSGELEYVNNAKRRAGKTLKRISSTAIEDYVAVRSKRAPRRGPRSSAAYKASAV